VKRQSQRLLKASRCPNSNHSATFSRTEHTNQTNKALYIKSRTRLAAMVGKNQGTSFKWEGAQGTYIKQKIAEGKLSPGLWSTAKDVPGKPNKDKAAYKIIYEASDKETLRFQQFFRSFENAARNHNKEVATIASTGARRAANASTPAVRSTKAAAATTPRTPDQSTTKKATPVPNGLLRASGDLTWDTVHSYWRDKNKNECLSVWVRLPSGCRPEDIQVSIDNGGGRISILYKWPELLYDPSRLFQGQVDSFGSVMAGEGSSKAAGILATVETLKESDKANVTTKLTMTLEKKFEPNFINFNGIVVSKPSFFKLESDNGWSQYPVLTMFMHCMVSHSLDGYARTQAPAEADDFE
jgi:hypothetical protein